MKINEVKYQWAGELQKRNKTDLIVLHHAEASSCSAQNIHNWHLSNGWIGIGYHFLVRKDGSIYAGRPEWALGAHAKGYNDKSIGICFEGKFNKEMMSETQIKVGKELVEYLKKKYQITNVKRHSDLMVTDCPGSNFPFERITGVKENLILSFQQAAKADSFKFPQYGCDGKYGNETESVMKKCIIKKRLIHKYPNATKLVQRLLGVEQDGKCGSITTAAIKEFQKKNNLVADGCVGINTWKVLLGIK